MQIADHDTTPAGHDGLLATARAGDGDAFHAFYEAFVDPVTSYFRRRVGSAEAALDLTAEVFAAALAVVADRDRPLPENAVAWLFGIAHHKYVDAVRRGRADTSAREAMRMGVLVFTDADLERIDNLTDEDHVMRLLEELPGDQRDAVRARVVDEQSYAEVGTRLGCSELVARQRVSRGLRRLRTKLGDHR